MNNAQFVMSDIETLGTPRECRTNFIAMPSAAFIVWNGFENLPHVFYNEFNVQEQLDKGAKVNARTIAFWMQEAANGSTAAKRIISALEHTAETGVYALSFSPFDLDEFINENPTATIYDALQVMLSSYGEIPFYGNGPEFDLSIYEAVVSNVSPDTGAMWTFNKTSSARTSKEMYRDAGMDYNILLEESYTYAAQVMEELNLGNIGMTPVKHNPIFDALAEAYVVASIKEHFIKKRKNFSC